MEMTKRVRFFLLPFLVFAVSCASTPPPSEEELAALDDARSEAVNARESALAVGADGYFQTEWENAESDFHSGDTAGRESVIAVTAAIELFNSARDVYYRIAADSAPLYQTDLNAAIQDMTAARQRAASSKQVAEANNGQRHFPSEWRVADEMFTLAEEAADETLSSIRTATGHFVQAADGFDEIAENSRPLHLAELEFARNIMQEALTRTENARNTAQTLRAPSHFSAEWRDAEAALRTARSADSGSVEDVTAATTRFNEMTAIYSDLAARSRPLTERDDAQRALDAAMARATRSRGAAVAASADFFFPNEWRVAETRNQSGVSSPRGTVAQINTATGHFNAVADAYDNLATRSAPLATAARNEANAEMQAAMARATASRQAAMDVEGQNRFQEDWRAAEELNNAARRGGRTTIEEMRNVVNQLYSAANAYDSITQRAGPLFARERADAERALQAAESRAERSRQAAIAAEGQTQLPNEWRAAENQNAAAGRARRGTNAEMRAAAALFATAADSFDDITRRSRPIVQAARNQANSDFQAAQARATRSRQAAMDVEGQTMFADDWSRAEGRFAAGRTAPRTNTAEFAAATALLNSAADGFDDIANRAGPIVTAARKRANTALQTARSRAATSRQAAMTAEGNTRFPTEWRAAEAQNTAATRARTTSVEEMQSATALFAEAANSYDAIARQSAPLVAAERRAAETALNVAQARAARSRQAAINAEGQTMFADDWTRAENRFDAGRTAPRTNAAEIAAAAAQLNSAADGFDDIANRAGPLVAAAREQANTALQAARSRAATSRQAAMAAEGNTRFPTEWRAAEAQNAAATRARTTSVEEIQSATALFTEVANSYDVIARQSVPLAAAERRAAETALNAAITRANRSRQQAERTDAATNLPNEWRDAETRNRNAENARRETVTEMRAATNLYIAAAEAFDDVVARNVALGAESDARQARELAERARQNAVSVGANIAVADAFNGADNVFGQAAVAFNARNFAEARDRYNQSAAGFAAAAEETERRRRESLALVDEAIERYEQSRSFAVNAGAAMEGMNVP